MKLFEENMQLSAEECHRIDETRKQDIMPHNSFYISGKARPRKNYLGSPENIKGASLPLETRIEMMRTRYMRNEKSEWLSEYDYFKSKGWLQEPEANIENQTDCIQQEQSGSVLIKRLTLPRNTGNK